MSIQIQRPCAPLQIGDDIGFNRQVGLAVLHRSTELAPTAIAGIVTRGRAGHAIPFDAGHIEQVPFDRQKTRQARHLSREGYAVKPGGDDDLIGFEDVAGRQFRSVRRNVHDLARHCPAGC